MCVPRFGLVWFTCLTVYQFLMGYLKSKLDIDNLYTRIRFQVTISNNNNENNLFKWKYVVSNIPIV